MLRASGARLRSGGLLQHYVFALWHKSRVAAEHPQISPELE